MFELLCFLKHNTAYEMRISDCSSDVCSSDLSGINALQQLTMIALVVDPNAPDPSTAVGGAGRHPTYSRMIAGDGKWFTSGALGPRFEAMFMEVIGLGSIVEDERLGGSLANMVAPENIGWVQKAVEEAVLKQTRQYWLDRLDAVGIPSGPIAGREGWLDHPQVAAMGIPRKGDGAGTGLTVGENLAG